MIEGRPSRKLARQSRRQSPSGRHTLFGLAGSELHRHAAALGFVGSCEQLLAIG